MKALEPGNYKELYKVHCIQQYSFSSNKEDEARTEVIIGKLFWGGAFINKKNNKGIRGGKD